MAVELFAPGKSSPYFAKIKDLHAQFHEEAGKVLDLALRGKKADAEKAMSMDSKYRELSGALTREMMNWQKSWAEPGRRRRDGVQRRA